MTKKSGYALLHEVLCESYKRNNRPLSPKQVRRTIQNTIGISFPSDTTLEDILKGLEDTKLIVRCTPYGSEGEEIIPLNVRELYSKTPAHKKGTGGRRKKGVPSREETYQILKRHSEDIQAGLIDR